MDVQIPVDEQGRMLLNFPGRWTDFDGQYSVADLLAMENTEAIDDIKAAFEGSIVLIADLSGETGDFGPIPLQPQYPLAGIHITVANAILQRAFLREHGLLASFLPQLAFLLLLILPCWRLRAKPFAWVCFTVLTTMVGVSVVAMVVCGNVFRLAEPVITVALSAIGLITYRFTTEEREKFFIHQAFSHYVGPTVLKKIKKNPGLLSLSGERKTLTVLFADISDFTTWSKSQSPETIRAMLNDYFEEVSLIVFKHDGYVDKYIGDGMMAIFGDPIPHPDHTLRAVHCAIDMQRRIAALRDAWALKVNMHVSVRIGINTGEMLIGSMGSKSRMNYTVLGANVNLAERLESCAPVGGIAISAAVHREIRDEIAAHSLGMVGLKGYEEPMEVFLVDF
jgi:adenylate cyclase